jgi:hypothetical protein
LIQSVSGPSIYTEWLDRHGTGFRHVGIFTDNLAADVEALEALEAQGLVVSQSGRGYGLEGDGGFAYFDSPHCSASSSSSSRFPGSGGHLTSVGQRATVGWLARSLPGRVSAHSYSARKASATAGGL